LENVSGIECGDKRVKSLGLTSEMECSEPREFLAGKELFEADYLPAVEEEKRGLSLGRPNYDKWRGRASKE
jgi:hypothetical protein